MKGYGFIPSIWAGDLISEFVSAGHACGGQQRSHIFQRMQEILLKGELCIWTGPNSFPFFQEAWAAIGGSA
jgi:hypothetical protein